VNSLITILVQLLGSLLLVRFLIQAVRADFYNPISQTVFKLTAPAVEPLGRLLPSVGRFNSAALALAIAVYFIAWTVKGAPPLVALVGALYGLLVQLADIYFWGILLLALASWIGSPSHPAVQLVGQLMEPYVGPFRRVIPPLGMLDLSPMAALLVLIMIRDRLLPMAVNALQPLLG
jgi:YggT family protein